MVRREMGYNIEDSGKNWSIEEQELKLLVENNCYKDYSNKSIEVDIFGSKVVNDTLVYVLGECKFRNREMKLTDIKCFLIKSNIIAKKLI